MPRVPRYSYETCFFHIVVQGLNREYIFKNNAYIEKYLDLISKYNRKYSVKIIAYCIMNNHAHLLIYTEKIPEMSNFMKSINTIYAKFYNEEEGRVGYVFRDRYVSEPIYDNKYLYYCIGYIHMNPVEAKFVENPNLYLYSSYNNYICKDGIIDKEILENLFETDENYMDNFLELTKIKCQFIDYKIEVEDARKSIYNYCNIKKISLEQVKNDVKNLNELVIYLNENYDISTRKIAKLLKMKRNQIIKIINN